MNKERDLVNRDIGVVDGALSEEEVDVSIPDGQGVQDNEEGRENDDFCVLLECCLVCPIVQNSLVLPLLGKVVLLFIRFGEIGSDELTNAISDVLKFLVLLALLKFSGKFFIDRFTLRIDRFNLFPIFA